MKRKAKESELTKTGKVIRGKYYDFTLGRDNLFVESYRWATLDEFKEVLAYGMTVEAQKLLDKHFEKERK